MSQFCRSGVAKMFRDLRPNTGAVDVKEVGHELGVRYVLEGSLRKAGNRIRVTAQLVEAETGRHVWAERYDRDLADIFASRWRERSRTLSNIPHKPAMRSSNLP
jgi:TolB-like protein